jgi:hypothetical protein
MLIILAVIAVMGGFMTVGAVYLKVAKIRSLDRLAHDVEADVRGRLGSIADSVGGRIVEGPALKSPAGWLTLLASQAPKNLVIDVTKFTAAVGTSQLLTIAGVADAKKIIQTKNMHPVKVDDPEIGKTHLVLSSDESFARAVVTSKLIGQIQALDHAVRARTRLQMAGGRAVILATRGLSKPEEIKAFHDGCAEVIGVLTSAIPGATSA